MAKNLMTDVAKLLGVEMCEPFYVITKDGERLCSYSDNDLFKLCEIGLTSINNGDGC